MASAVLSLLGLYNYDNTVLDQLTLPAALNKSLVKDNILMETAELEILYPDPNILKYMIGIWSKRRVKIWEDLYDTTVLVYNPIWNKDGTITETETEGVNRKADNTETRNLTGSRNETRNLAGSSNETKNLADSMAHDVFGYNSSTAAHQSVDTGSNTGTDNISTTNTGTDNIALTDSGTVKNNGTGSEDRNLTRTRVEQGNIGVTSTQQLIKEQRDVVEFSVIEKIIDDFKQQFCICVY